MSRAAAVDSLRTAVRALLGRPAAPSRVSRLRRPRSRSRRSLSKEPRKSNARAKKLPRKRKPSNVLARKRRRPRPSNAPARKRRRRRLSNAPARKPARRLRASNALARKRNVRSRGNRKQRRAHGLRKIRRSRVKAGRSPKLHARRKANSGRKGWISVLNPMSARRKLLRKACRRNGRARDVKQRRTRLAPRVCVANLIAAQVPRDRRTRPRAGNRIAAQAPRDRRMKPRAGNRIAAQAPRDRKASVRRKRVAKAVSNSDAREPGAFMGRAPSENPFAPEDHPA